MRFPLHRIAVLLLVGVSVAQDSPATKPATERIFSEPVQKVETALHRLPGGVSGRLPMLDGFVVPGTRPLSGYQRPYYQCEVRVVSAKSGGSLVKVTAKITAWFSGAGGSGYEALESNGRVESDLLDRLQDALATTSAGNVARSDIDASRAPAAKTKIPTSANVEQPQIDAPSPRLPDHPVGSLSKGEQPTNPQDKDLRQEAKNLEEILRNQSHPSNLIAVKQDSTPVLQSPSVDAKVLFLASAEDEFEVLEENPGWVHVRISGLSRGWFRRSAVEILRDSAARSGGEMLAVPNDKPVKSAPAESQRLFSVSSEEIGGFPGEWAPLRGKNVKIISLQQAQNTGRITSPQEKKQFAEGLFQKQSQGLAAEAGGVVLIFDAEDGGMVAATRATLEQWKSGALSDAAFWQQCFLDPPEILGAN